MDGGNQNLKINLHKEMISPDNINDLFEKHNVPYEFDLLSVDVDMLTYWVWDAIDPQYKPRVIVSEFNTGWGWDVTDSRTVPRDTETIWYGGPYHGATPKAIYNLGRKKGYVLIYSDLVNMYFVPQSLLQITDEEVETLLPFNQLAKQIWNGGWRTDDYIYRDYQKWVDPDKPGELYLPESRPLARFNGDPFCEEVEEEKLPTPTPTLTPTLTPTVTPEDETEQNETALEG
jgi:hypothetical protein